LGKKLVEEVNGGGNSIVHKTQTQTKTPSTSMEGWNTIWPSMPILFLWKHIILER
jgi:hypothetical protein